MTPFKDIIHRARTGCLEDAEDLAPRLASPDFAQLTDFDSPDTLPMQVSALLYMLSRYPLNPTEVPRMKEQLPGGVVRLDFFELSSPVPVLYLVPGHPALTLLQAALEINIQMPQYRAASAMAKWKSLEKLGNYHRWERTCMARYRDTLPWPTSLDYKDNREAAKKAHEFCCQAMWTYELKIRQSRAQRKQRIRELAGVTGSWLDILKDMAKHLLTVPTPYLPAKT